MVPTLGLQDLNKAIIFSRRKINIGSLQKLTLFGRDIEFSDQITFLGMTLDKKLTWGEHIKQEAHGPHRSPELTAVNMYM